MTLAQTLYQPPRAPASLPSWALNDVYWWSALHILTGPALAGDARVWAHVDLDKRRFDGYQMLAEGGWTSAERTMVAAACALFHGDTDEHTPPAFEALWSSLDADGFHRVLTALCIRRESPIPPAVGAAS